MIFEITRASLRDEKPCEEAYKLEGEWKIKINSLGELLKFIGKYGAIIIDDKEIVIYDDYIE